MTLWGEWPRRPRSVLRYAPDQVRRLLRMREGWERQEKRPHAEQPPQRRIERRPHPPPRPTKSGCRFSFRLARPSRTSGPAKPRNSSASEASKVGPAMRSQLFSVYLVQLIALGAPRASLRGDAERGVEHRLVVDRERDQADALGLLAAHRLARAADSISPWPCRRAAARRSPRDRPPRHRASCGRRSAAPSSPPPKYRRAARRPAPPPPPGP